MARTKRVRRDTNESTMNGPLAAAAAVVVAVRYGPRTLAGPPRPHWMTV
jgi:hypothetical protein